MNNTEIKEMLKNAAYVLISSFTARKAFLEMVDKIDENSETPLSESFVVEAKKVRDAELEKLKERMALYA